jgi:hypothetical protein
MTGHQRRVTRRHVLGGAAAVAGAGLLAGPAGVLGREPGGGTVFSRAIGAVDGVSPVIAT